MADLSRTIELIFGAIDQTGPAINSVRSSLDGLSSATDKISNVLEPVSSLTTKLLLAEAALLSFAAVLGKNAVDASLEFTRAQVELAKLIDEAEGDVSSYNSEIFKLSENYGVFAEAVILAAADFKRSGFDTATAFELVKQSLDAAISGELEATEASDLLRRTLAGFRIEADQSALAIQSVEEILGTINLAANNFNANFDETLIAFSRLSPVAADAGFSFTDLVAAIIPVISVFKEGEETANALRTIFLRLTSDNKNVVEALEEIGVAQFNVNGELRSGRDIYFDTVEALAKLEPNQRTRLTQMIAETEQAPRLSAAVGGLNSTQTVLTGTYKNLVTVQDEVNKKLESAPSLIDQANVAWKNFLIVLGEEFEPQLEGISSAFKTLFQTLREQAEGGAFDELFEAIRPQLESIERLALEIAAALPEALKNADFSGFIDGIKVLVGDFNNLSINAENTQKFIEGLGGAFETLSRFTRGVIEVFKGAAEVFGPIIKYIASLDDDTLKLAGQIGGLSLVLVPIVATVGEFSVGLRSLVDIASGIVTGGGLISLIFGNPERIAEIGLLISKLAGVAGLGLLSYELAKISGLGAGLNNVLAPDAIFGEGATLGTVAADVAEALKKLNEQFDSAKSREFAQKLDDANATLRDAQKYMFEANKANKDLNISIEDALRVVIAIRGPLGALPGDLDELNKAGYRAAEGVDALEASADPASFAIEGLDKVLSDLNKQLDKTGDSTKDLSFDAAKHQAEAYANEIKILDSNFITFGGRVGTVGGEVQRLGNEFLSAGEDILTVDGSTAKWIRTLDDDGNPVFTQINSTLGAMKKETKSLAEQVDEAAKKSNDFLLSWLELQSQERVQLFEIKADVDKAELEAAAKSFEAAFASIAAGFESSGNILSSALDQLSAFANVNTSFNDAFDLLERSIDREFDIREQLVDSQSSLNDALADFFLQRAEAARRGESEIKISTEGLSPALELVMFEIAERMRVAVTADEGDFLLAVGGGA